MSPEIRSVPLLFLALCPLACAAESRRCRQGMPCSGERVIDWALETQSVNLLQQKISMERVSKTGHAESSSAETKQVDPRKFVAEFVATAIFVFIGCGTAMSIAKEPGSAWVLQVSLTFGLAITVLVYALGKYSGAQINCAVTLGLVVYGEVTVLQGLCNFAAQLVGSVLGALVLKLMYPAEKDLTGDLACNSLADGWSWMSALIGEFVGTFVLMYVVFETAINPEAAANRSEAPLAIGFAVFLAHSMLIPVDGCSINPTRSFGPAVVQALFGGKGAAPFHSMWIFWWGPLLGAAAAAEAYALMSL